MREYLTDIKNLVIKHWGKLIITYLLASLILNFGDFKRGLLGEIPANTEAQNK
jgi:hypothetical protein